MAVLRPEVVESYWRLKLREYVQAEVTKRREARKETGAAESAEQTNGTTSEVTESTKTTDAGKEVATKDDETNGAEKKEPEQERVDVSGFQFTLNPDVYCGQRPQTEEEKAEWAKDEEQVRAACKYLTAEVIPKTVSACIIKFPNLKLMYPTDSRLTRRRCWLPNGWSVFGQSNAQAWYQHEISRRDCTSSR